MSAVRIDDGLRLPGDPLGLGPGPHEACAIDWPAMDDDDRRRFAADHLTDWSDPGALAAGLEPIAIIGTPGMKQLGPTWREALPSAAVLFLDHRVGRAPAPVVGWDGSVHGALVAIAASLDELA